MKINQLHEYDGILLGIKNTIVAGGIPHMPFTSWFSKSLAKKYNRWYNNPSNERTHSFVDDFLTLAAQTLDDE